MNNKLSHVLPAVSFPVGTEGETGGNLYINIFIYIYLFFFFKPRHVGIFFSTVTLPLFLYQVRNTLLVFALKATHQTLPACCTLIKT